MRGFHICSHRPGWLTLHWVGVGLDDSFVEHRSVAYAIGGDDGLSISHDCIVARRSETLEGSKR